MYNVSQSEYINTLTTTIINILANLAVLVAANLHVNYLIIRAIYLLATVATGLVLSFIAKRRYKFIDFSAEPDFGAIKGTKDVVFQKLTILIRSSAPMIFISVLISSAFASIYSVYIFIYGFVQKLIMMVINATQSGIGQLIAERDRKDVYSVYRVFEFASTVSVLFLMSIAVPLTMPFIRFYTQNVKDVNYVDWWLLFFIAGNILIGVLHIPSGIIINMSGAFRQDRNYQIISCAVMIVTGIVLSIFWNVYGVLAGIMLASIVLAVCEIRYTRSVFFREKYKDFFKPIILITAVLTPVIFFEIRFVPHIFTIPSFLVTAVIVAIINAVFIGGIILLFERERTFELVKRIISIFRKRKKDA